MRTHYRIPTLITLLTFFSLLVPASPAQADMASGALITVNTLIDDGNVSNGTCSLREAVRAANTNSPVDACPAGNGADTILLGVGTYQLSIAGINEDNAETGDLDIREDLVIQGMGMNSTVVDGGDIDRVFHIYWADPLPVVHFKRLTIRNGNVTTDRYGGAGILNEYGTLTLHAVSLEYNDSYYNGVESAVGGGMDNLGVATLIDSHVSNNGADDGGGIFNGLDGDLYLYNSTFFGNQAVIDPGAGLDNTGVAMLENVTISGNNAPSGGGIFNDGTLDILNSSILSNSGGNIENAGTITLKNTLVVNSLSGPNCTGGGSTLSSGYNLEDTNTCHFDQPSDLFDVADPLVGPLADNGGPTLTHVLIWPSPAIDQGDDLFCPSKDQRGASRVGDHCDIGAYEYDGVFLNEVVFLPIVLR